MNNNNNNNNNNGLSSWVTAGLGLVAAAGIGGAAYYLSGGQRTEQPQQRQRNAPALAREPPASARISSSSGSDADNNSTSSYLSNMMSRIVLNNCNSSSSSSYIMERAEPVIPDYPVITNLNSLLNDIHVRYIRLKQFNLHFEVFDAIFNDLHKKMKQVDPYYHKYSSTVQFAGSHYDNLRINKPDEFDMDIVIGLPLNIRINQFSPGQSDINIEPKSPGYLQLKMGEQFLKLPMRDNEEWLNNRAAFQWMDSSHYLLRSKFIEWWEGVVNKALNLYEVGSYGRPLVYVKGVPYIINVSKSGPAMTLLIRNASRNFRLDVDLVPALKFPEDRWPISSSYRSISPNCKKDYWMVVPKLNKESTIEHDQMRSWRIALHNQERELMYNSYNLRQAIRFLKKLRDSQDMKKIASYYIKTLFFWEITEINDELYWRQSYEVLFKRMVRKLHQALVIGKIPYFWNKNNNLIGGVPRDTLTMYANKLVPLIEVLDDPARYKLVAKYLLTPEEFRDYNSRYLHI